MMAMNVFELFTSGCAALLAKWLLRGKVNEGCHPIFRNFYCRWLITSKLIDHATTSFQELFGNTFLISIWFKLLGANIGVRSIINTNVKLADLVSIGADSKIERYLVIDPAIVEKGEPILKRIHIVNNCRISRRAYVTAGTNVPDNQVVSEMSNTTNNTLRRANAFSDHLPQRHCHFDRLFFGTPALLFISAIPYLAVKIILEGLKTLIESSFGSGSFSCYPTWLLIPQICWFTWAECYFLEVVLYEWIIMGRYKKER